MKITLHLTDDDATTLQASADRRTMSVEEYAELVLAAEAHFERKLHV